MIISVTLLKKGGSCSAVGNELLLQGTFIHNKALAKCQFRLFLSIYIHAEEENKSSWVGVTVGVGGCIYF